MDIKAVVQKNIKDIEMQLNTPLHREIVKPMVFIDNISFLNKKDPLAVVYLELFDGQDVVQLKSNLLSNDAFNILNLLGDECIYFLWGDDNKEIVRDSLEQWQFTISIKTEFIDLKKEAIQFYNRDIEDFDDVLDLISFSNSDVETIFKSKESIMFSLYVDMVNKGYKNRILNLTLGEAITQCELACIDTLSKGVSFRKERSSIEILGEEMPLLKRMVSFMKQYNTDMEYYLTQIIKSGMLNDIYINLISEKASMCRIKKDTCLYLDKLIEAYSKEDFMTYKFYLKSTELYSLMEDAYILSENIDDLNDSFSEFINCLASTFRMSTVPYAYAFILRKNVMKKLNG